MCAVLVNFAHKLVNCAWSKWMAHTSCNSLQGFHRSYGETVCCEKKPKYTESSFTNYSRSESYSVLSPFLSKLRYAYRRNRQNLFCLLVYFKFESEIAVKSESVFVCSISKTPYFLLVLQCSKSIIHHSKWCICQ